MKELLQIDSSIFGAGGQSSQLSAYFVERWKAANPGSHVTSRNLSVEPIAHLDGNAVAGFMAKAEDLSESQAVAVERSNELIAEIQKADTMVIGLPMYNMGVPSMLKAWIDHIAPCQRRSKFAPPLTPPTMDFPGLSCLDIAASTGRQVRRSEELA